VFGNGVVEDLFEPADELAEEPADDLAGDRRVIGELP